MVALGPGKRIAERTPRVSFKVLEMGSHTIACALMCPDTSMALGAALYPARVESKGIFYTDQGPFPADLYFTTFQVIIGHGDTGSEASHGPGTIVASSRPRSSPARRCV
jgi:hypothetical protein